MVRTARIIPRQSSQLRRRATFACSCEDSFDAAYEPDTMQESARCYEDIAEEEDDQRKPV